VKLASPPTTSTTTRVMLNPRIRKTLYLLHSKTIPPPPHSHSHQNEDRGEEDNNNNNNNNNNNSNSTYYNDDHYNHHHYNHHVDKSMKTEEHDEPIDTSTISRKTIISLINIRLQKWLYVTMVLKALQNVKKTIINMKQTILNDDSMILR
jgi:hypothetical protein